MSDPDWQRMRDLQERRRQENWSAFTQDLGPDVDPALTAFLVARDAQKLAAPQMSWVVSWVDGHGARCASTPFATRGQALSLIRLQARTRLVRDPGYDPESSEFRLERRITITDVETP